LVIPTYRTPAAEAGAPKRAISATSRGRHRGRTGGAMMTSTSVAAPVATTPPSTMASAPRPSAASTTDAAAPTISPKVSISPMRRKSSSRESNARDTVPAPAIAKTGETSWIRCAISSLSSGAATTGASRKVAIVSSTPAKALISVAACRWALSMRRRCTSALPNPS
jgi:hypothetical protein